MVRSRNAIEQVSRPSIFGKHTISFFSLFLFQKHIEFKEKSDTPISTDVHSEDLNPIKKPVFVPAKDTSSTAPYPMTSATTTNMTTMVSTPQSSSSSSSTPSANNTIIEKQKKQIESLERQVLELQQELMDFQLLMDEGTKELEMSSKRFQEARMALKREQEKSERLKGEIAERDAVIEAQAAEIASLKEKSTYKPPSAYQSVVAPSSETRWSSNTDFFGEVDSLLDSLQKTESST
jgi:hypothetical protein